MTWITLELGHTSAPHSRADAERPGRHSHAERRNDHQIRLTTDRANAPRWHASCDAPRHKWHRLRIQLAGRMTWITLELGRASAPHSRADAERPGRHSHAERGNDHQIRLTTDRANAPRWHASRDAPRHKWHRLRIQLVGRMTWITLEPGHTSAPHSRADAERPVRRSHAVGTIITIITISDCVRRR